MKTASLALIAASLFITQGAIAGDTVFLPAQQNNCANLKNNAQKATQAQSKLGRAAVVKSAATAKSAHGEHPIDVVICLDTSNSMDGLINSAKEKIWDIVNELATAKPSPHLRVGLYAYGSPSFGAQSGYVHKVLDLTDDLDEVFKQLTALSTNGGDEYCARVISSALNQQPWSDDRKSLKIIVDAGNETATLDPKLNVFDVAKAAATKGVVINTIYCGSPADSDSADWRRLATAADGQFAAIDQDRGTVVVSTPFDQKLADLNGSINRTYLAYGKGGYAGQQKQAAADSLSFAMSPSNIASRVVAKMSGQYRNSSWDLVDASKEKDFNLDKCKREELPAEMQKMSAQEQKAYLTKKVQERADIQKQIAELNTQRSKYIQEQMKKSGKSADKAFDVAMLKALREQAQRNGFSFESK